MPNRMKAESGDQAASLLGRVEVRHDEAERAVVERPRSLIQRSGANTHNRGWSAKQGRQADLRDFLRRNATVLRIDEKPVVSCRLGKHGHGGAAQMMHA